MRSASGLSPDPPLDPPEVRTRTRDCKPPPRRACGRSLGNETTRRHRSPGRRRPGSNRQNVGLWRERSEANRGDPTYKLTVSASTNADAQEIGAAIPRRIPGGRTTEPGRRRPRWHRPQRGEVQATALAIGDRVRLIDRVHDARAQNCGTVLASNGEVVEIYALTNGGIVIRYSSGTEGLVS
jgi:hypothetical protein